MKLVINDLVTIGDTYRRLRRRSLPIPGCRWQPYRVGEKKKMGNDVIQIRMLAVKHLFAS